jgi:hypothetical protein
MEAVRSSETLVSIHYTVPNVIISASHYSLQREHEVSYETWLRQSDMEALGWELTRETRKYVTLS